MDNSVSLNQMTLMKLLARLKFLPIILIGVLFLSRCEKDKKSGLPTDGDGNEYDTVLIGTQVWLAENLKTTKYRNGDPISLITDNTKWTAFQSGAYCWYGNDPSYKNTYGALYNWHAAKLELLCPIGYHVPTEAEWTTMINYLGGESIAGAKLKDTHSQFWLHNNDCATNETGFEARPGGVRSYTDGNFNSIRLTGLWWVSSPSVYEGRTTGIVIRDQLCGVDKPGCDYNSGISVRCIKDN